MLRKESPRHRRPDLAASYLNEWLCNAPPLPPSSLRYVRAAPSEPPLPIFSSPTAQAARASGHRLRAATPCPDVRGPRASGAGRP